MTNSAADKGTQWVTLNHEGDLNSVDCLILHILQYVNFNKTQNISLLSVILLTVAADHCVFLNFAVFKTNQWDFQTFGITYN